MSVDTWATFAVASWACGKDVGGSGGGGTCGRRHRPWSPIRAPRYQYGPRPSIVINSPSSTAVDGHVVDPYQRQRVFPF